MPTEEGAREGILQENKGQSREQESHRSVEMDLDLKGFQLPRINSRKVTRQELLYIYAAACWYATGWDRTRGKYDLRCLLGILTGRDVIKDGPVLKVPRFVTDFIDNEDREVVEEVKRVAIPRKEDLLREIGAQWQKFKLQLGQLEHPVSASGS